MTSAHRANMATDYQAYILGETVDQIQKGRTRVGITSHHQTLGSAIRHIWEKTSTKSASASSFTTSIKAEKGCHLLPSLQNYLILRFMCSHLFIWPSQWPLVFLTHKHPHPYTVRHQKQSNEHQSKYVSMIGLLDTIQRWEKLQRNKQILEFWRFSLLNSSLFFCHEKCPVNPQNNYWANLLHVQALREWTQHEAVYINNSIHFSTFEN